MAKPVVPAHRPTRQQIEVLFLSSLDPDLPDISTLVDQTQTSILEGVATPVHFSFEYLDFSSSLADSSRKRATASYLHNKYSGQTFDLVITIGADTSVFAEQVRAKLFPDAAMLFYVVNPGDATSWHVQKTGRTGVIRKANYLPTLQLALRQNPGTYRVIVVSGSSDAEKLEAKIARGQFREYESNLEFEYLTDLQFAQLGPRLASVQPDSVVVFLDFETDSTGEQFIPARILPALPRPRNCRSTEPTPRSWTAEWWEAASPIWVRWGGFSGVMECAF